MNKEIKVRLRGEDSERGITFEYNFRCIELQQKGQYYGNGIYVHVLKDDVHSWQCWDARYEKDYDFLDFVRRNFESYYGKNLRQLEMFIEESKDFNVCVFNQKYNQ